MDIYLKFVGGGSLDGVPARDLTQEEAERLGVSRLLESGLYVRVEEKMRKPAVENKMVRRKAENKRGEE